MTIRDEIRHILKDWGCLRDFSINDENSVIDSIMGYASSMDILSNVGKLPEKWRGSIVPYTQRDIYSNGFLTCADELDEALKGGN